MEQHWSDHGAVDRTIFRCFAILFQYWEFFDKHCWWNLVDTIMLTNNIDKIIKTSFVEMDSTSQGTLIHMSIVPVEYFLGIK